MRVRAFFLIISLVIAISPVPGRTTAEPALANQPVSEYKSRRLKLMEQVKEGVIVLGGAHEADFGEVGRFRQNNHFQYLTGVQTPGSYLILAPKGIKELDGLREFLFIPPRNPGTERWTGPQMGPGGEAEAAFGVERVLPTTDFKKTLERLLVTEKIVYTVTPRAQDTTRTRELMLVEQLRNLVSAVNTTNAASSGGAAEVRNIATFINRQRQTKSQPEIAMLQKAIDATGVAQAGVARLLRPGAFEYELEGEILGTFTRLGAERASFPSIVGSGIYSTVLHYNENRKRVESDELVVVDIGAEYSYYAADITRTYPSSGKFSPRQREIYDLVLLAQRRCEESVEVRKTALGQLTLIAREVFKASPLRAKDAQGVEHTMDYFFIHSTSHWLGMDVHDVGEMRPLQPGDVFTIEPGLYIPAEKLGVRIEDDYLIAPTGLRKLSAGIPSGPGEVEALMKKSASRS
ncbi:MAG: aminopeptidase P N-terminal domain-containing protein [Acidobacteriota bacterium]